MTPTETRACTADIVTLLLEACATEQQARQIIGNALHDFNAIYENRAEQYWLDAQDPETIARREQTHAERLLSAGRGHLIGG